MKRLSIVLSAAAILAAGFASDVEATPMFGDGGISLQGILDDITVGGDSSVDVTTDALDDSLDSLWSITGVGSSTSTIVIELAGNMNTNELGVYDAADPSNRVLLFGGAAGAGAQATISIKDDGRVFFNNVYSTTDFAGNLFGFYLKGPGSVGTFFTDSSLNPNGEDHVVVYQGTNTDTIKLADLAAGLWTNNEYIFAFEDLSGFDPTDDSSEPDYNDFVFAVESIIPIPEPSMMLMWAVLSLIGLCFYGRRRC